MKTKLLSLQLIIIFVFFCVGCQKAQLSTSTMTLIASGLNSPTCITNAGDSRLFVSEQGGYIRIVKTSGSVNVQPFLDIRSKVKSGGEQGLLGVAFHPQYQGNGYFYVNYTDKGDSTHISRFEVSPENPDSADPQSEYKLMTIYQPYTNHNGGDLSFGPDGYLYIGLGDGGSGGDPGNRAQNLNEYLGKILRIDVNQGNPYAVPSSNPFYNNANAKKEIWALGLRNPWRFSFDRITHDLWIGDVGQDAIEEIDLQVATSRGGENYGWRCYEGNQVYNSTGCSTSSSYIFPVFTYPHDAECSVTGGYVYRGNTSSLYYGHYFFADYCSDRIWTLHNVSGNWVKEDFGQFQGNNFSTFGEDVSGQLYIAGFSSGKIYRVIDISSSIVKNYAASGIKIIRYPVSDKIKIETDRNDLPVIHLYLCNTIGKLYFQTSFRKSSYEFSTGFLPTGTYLLNIIINGKKIVNKLIKD